MTLSANIRRLSAVTFAVLSIVACRTPGTTHYLDDEPPGLIPHRYAPDILGRAGVPLQNVTMTADGSEHLFSEVTLNDWSYSGIIRLRRLEEHGLVFDSLALVRDSIVEKTNFIGEPQISPDGGTLVFVAGYPPDIWISRRDGTGEWDMPTRLSDEINSSSEEFYPNVACDGSLYFMSKRTGGARIYRSELRNGQYQAAKMVQASFNQDDAGDHVLSRKMDYVVFSADREGGYGQADLYVSFRNQNGAWSEAYHLGSEINTDAFEFGPYISPDGRYLFFSRRDKWKDAVFSDVYWVSSDVVSRLADAVRSER